MKNLKSDLWQNLLSPLKTSTHLHNVDDYYYNVDVDGGGDADGEDDADDGDDDGG